MYVIDLIAGLVIGVLTGMGMGGGGLLVIYLRLFKDFPQLDSQGTNLLFFIFAALGSLLIHFKNRQIEWKAVLIIASVGTVGSLAGSRFAMSVPEGLTGKIFGGVLILSGIITLFRTHKKPLTAKARKIHKG